MIRKILPAIKLLMGFILSVGLSACIDSKSSSSNFKPIVASLLPDLIEVKQEQEGKIASTENAKSDQKEQIPTVTRSVRIMPFGDSITSGFTYRKPLWDLLKSNNISNINFVGSLNGDSSPDGDHEGHACYKITLVLLAPGTGTFKKCTPNENSVGDFRDLDTWFSRTRPDIVLWHMGTNDAASRVDPLKVMDAFSATLSKLRERNPKVIILIAKILPMTVADVSPINAAIPGWAVANSTNDSKIVVVDMNTGFDPSLTYDGIHPNAAGGKWMADKWFNALKSILR